MKKLLITVLIAGLLSSFAYAEKGQDSPAKPKANAQKTEKVSPAAAMKAAGFSNKQIKTVSDLLDKGEAEVRTLLADSRIIDAQVTRLLVESKPDLREVENQLNKAASLQVKVRMIRIKLELEIRALVGDDKWTAYKKANRADNSDK